MHTIYGDICTQVLFYWGTGVHKAGYTTGLEKFVYPASSTGSLW